MTELTDSSIRYFQTPQTATIIKPVFVEDAYGLSTYNGKVLVRFHNNEIPSPMEVMYPAGGGANDYSGGPPTSGTVVLVTWAQGNMPLVINTYQLPHTGKAGFGGMKVNPGEKLFRACKQTEDENGGPETNAVSLIHMNDYGNIYMESTSHSASISVGKDTGYDSQSIDTGKDLAIQIAGPSSNISMDDDGGIVSYADRITSFCENLLWRVQTAASLIINTLTVIIRGNASISINGTTTITSYGEITVNAEGDVSVNSDGNVKLQGDNKFVLCGELGQFCTMGGDLSQLLAKKLKTDSGSGA